jgi:hypothetical protein
VVQVPKFHILEGLLTHVSFEQLIERGFYLTLMRAATCPVAVVVYNRSYGVRTGA